MSKKPRVLLVNDDGIRAPGLMHLWRGLKGYADMTIVAPATEHSGAGQSISMRSPLHLERVQWYDDSPAWSITGTPADCVKIALTLMADERPDVILSGINPGSNAGRNLFYSGTVGGVIEGVLQHIPGAALSCYTPEQPNFQLAEQYVKGILDFILANPLPPSTFLNVTFPPNQFKTIRGCYLARQGLSYWLSKPEERKHPEGHQYYWLVGEQAVYDEHEESDIALLHQGFLTAVPVRVGDLTHLDVLEKHRHSFPAFFPAALESAADKK